MERQRRTSSTEVVLSVVDAVDGVVVEKPESGDTVLAVFFAAVSSLSEGVGGLRKGRRQSRVRREGAEDEPNRVPLRRAPSPAH